jgi:hypothetical protein
MVRRKGTPGYLSLVIYFAGKTAHGLNLSNRPSYSLRSLVQEMHFQPLVAIKASLSSSLSPNSVIISLLI